MALFKKLTWGCLFAVVLFLSIKVVRAEDSCASLSLADQPGCYSKLISESQNQQKSLSSDISLLNNKISLTRSQINLTQDKIGRLTNDIASVSGKISSIESSLNSVTGVLLNRIVETYKEGRNDQVFFLLASPNFSDLLQRFEYLRIVQKKDKERLIQMAAIKKNYNDNKDMAEQKKKQVETLSAQLKNEKNRLDAQNREKQQLLVDTKNSEAEYQRLRAEAQVKLASFAAFANLVGTGVLGDQTKCNDGWSGCYYNQRDSKWAYRTLPGSGYTFATAGCTATSMAMVLSHYGFSVTPETMANFPEAFSFGDLRYNFSLNGANVNRSALPRYNQSAIDNELSAGRPVIIQLSSQSVSGSHFIVLISGSNGNYKMNDPVRENGHNIDFSQYYSIGQIITTDITRVN